jgi:hypothetical protein
MPNFSAIWDLNVAAFSGDINASDICIISIMSWSVNDDVFGRAGGGGGVVVVVVVGRAAVLGKLGMTMSSRLGIEGDVGSFSS